jgi:hypothetical protein
MTSGSDLLSTKELQKAYEEVAKNISTLSKKISELCKYIWAGSLALFYAALSSGKDTVAYAFYQQNKFYIFGAAVCGSIALISDYLQNVSGLKKAEEIVGWIEKNPGNITRDQLTAHRTTGYSKANIFFFRLKNVCCIAAAVLTAYSIVSFIAH